MGTTVPYSTDKMSEPKTEKENVPEDIKKRQNTRERKATVSRNGNLGNAFEYKKAFKIKACGRLFPEG